MLEQPSTVFVRHSIPVLNIQRNDPRFIPIPVVRSLVIIRVNAALSSHLHHFSTVQKRNHLFNDILGGLTLWRKTGCAVLRERKRHKPREKMEWGDYRYLLYTGDLWELIACKNIHTLLRHVQME